MPCSPHIESLARALWAWETEGGALAPQDATHGTGPLLGTFTLGAPKADGILPPPSKV